MKLKKSLARILGGGVATWLVCSAALAVFAVSGHGQAEVAVTRSFAPLPSYVTQTLVPSNVREFLIALGDRVQKPGKERLTLIGTHTDQSGVVPAQLVWEVGGRLRFDRTTVPPNSLVFDNVAGLLNAASVSDSDLAVLESLLDHSPESFLYGFVQGRAHRFLGGRFRTDDGKAPNYTGPWFDIYERFAPVPVVTDAPLRQKHFYFDSQTKLFAKATYIVVKGGAKVVVSTEQSKWKVNAGQATPGQIVRKEGGVTVFTFDIASAVVGPALADGLFPKP